MKRTERVMLPPSDLNPAVYNPRKITDDALERLKEGIREFGLVEPIVVRASDRMVIGGHQRLKAATALGFTEVPVELVHDIDDNETAALNIRLNNPHAQGEWDMPKLAEVLCELDASGYNVLMAGFTEQEVEDLLAWQDIPESDASDTSGEADEPFKDGDKIIVLVKNITATNEVLTAITALVEEHPEWDVELKEGRN